MSNNLISHFKTLFESEDLTWDFFKVLSRLFSHPLRVTLNTKDKKAGFLKGKSLFHVRRLKFVETEKMFFMNALSNLQLNTIIMNALKLYVKAKY